MCELVNYDKFGLGRGSVGDKRGGCSIAEALTGLDFFMYIKSWLSICFVSPRHRMQDEPLMCLRVYCDKALRRLTRSTGRARSEIGNQIPHYCYSS